MESTKTLFKINPKIFKGKKYEDVLIIKKKRAKTLLQKELKKPYTLRNYHLMSKLSKAIKNISSLLKELD